MGETFLGMWMLMRLLGEDLQGPDISEGVGFRILFPATLWKRVLCCVEVSRFLVRLAREICLVLFRYSLEMFDDERITRESGKLRWSDLSIYHHLPPASMYIYN